MSLLIVTNNTRLYRHLSDIKMDAILIDGHAKDVIRTCCDHIYEGWRLSADPLAGYLSRPNPYHTIFLQKDSNNRVWGKDLIRLERTFEQWSKYDNIIPMTARLLKDYEELDYSIAQSTLEGLLKTPAYYNCINN